MEKAYDVKDLMGKLKDQGLDVAEDAAKMAVGCILDWLAESAMKSDNKLDDIISPLLPIVKPHIMDMVDKIDGEEG